MAASGKVLIGIDLGTTVLKAAGFDAGSGRMLAQASKRLPVATSREGKREQSVADLDKALAAILGRLRRDLGGRWKAVAGIGIAAQGGSTIIADRKTGAALTPMILWNDRRAFSHQMEIAGRMPASFWRDVGMQDMPGAGLGRMSWLKDTHSGLFTESNIYAGAGEYLYFRLTGVWRQDAGNALQIGCYNAARQCLDERPLALVEVPVSFVAPMRQDHTTCELSDSAQRAFGLPGGIPAAGPYMDHEAGFMSASAVSTKPLQCSLGTAWVGNFILPEDTAGRSPFQLVLPAPFGSGRLVVQPLLTGNVTWDWGLENLVGRDHRKALISADGIFADELLPPFGLVAIPWNTQANPAAAGAIGGGTFFGVSAHTERAHLLRALAAGMAYELLRILEEVKLSGEVDCVVLGGGASRGRFFRKLIAALFSPLEVFTLADEDMAGTRGVLYAFDRKTSQARAVRVRPPAGGVCKRVMEGYRLYLEVFNRLYRQIGIGGAFTFTGEKEKRG